MASPDDADGDADATVEDDSPGARPASERDVAAEVAVDETSPLQEKGTQKSISALSDLPGSGSSLQTHLEDESPVTSVVAVAFAVSDASEAGMLTDTPTDWQS